MVPLGHAGGWDEMLYFLLPAVVFFLFLEVRRKRLEARRAAEPGDASSDRPDEPPAR